MKWNYGCSPFEILDTAKDKYMYALASIVGNNSYGHIKPNGSIDEYLIKLINEFVELAKEIFKGCEKVEFATDYSNIPEFGTVDHQSALLLSKFLEKEDIDLKEFIINPKYIVVIDGDEYCVFNAMKSVGMINGDNIEKEFCLDDCLYEYI